MERKNLLLLIATVLLVTGPHPLLQASFALDADASQEYSGVEGTESLLSTTAQELMQAYDLLDMLKKRSAELNHAAYEDNSGAATLPRTLDAIRNRLIKQQLLDVLSATPFSDPEKHIADCRAAITALEKYLQTLEEEGQKNRASRKPFSDTEMPRLSAFDEPAPSTSTKDSSQALSVYAIDTQPASPPLTPAPVAAPAPAAATAPGTPTEPAVAAAPGAPMQVPVAPAPVAPAEPVTTTPITLGASAAPVVPATPAASVAPMLTQPTAAPTAPTTAPVMAAALPLPTPK